MRFLELWPSVQVIKQPVLVVLTSSLKPDRNFFKKDIGDKLSEFLKRGKLNKEIKSTFITLIPKVSNPVELKDFKPINFVGCVYKL